MKFIALKSERRRMKRKYQPLADVMKKILTENECNDTYGRIHIYQALTWKQPKNAVKAYPDLRGAIIHSDRGSQYTSQLYWDAIHMGYSKA